MFGRTTFARIILVLLLFLALILALYGYSNRTNTDLVRQTIQSANMSQMSLLLNQLDDNVNQLSLFSLMLGRHPLIQTLPYIEYLDSFQQRQTKLMLDQVLTLQSAAASWENSIELYMPGTGELFTGLGTSTPDSFDAERFRAGGWTFRQSVGGGSFVTFTREPFAPSGSLEGAEIIIKVEFSGRNIAKMLNEFKQNGYGDPFLYRAGQPPILNGTSDTSLVSELVAALERQPPENGDSRIIQLNGQRYAVNILKSAVLDWYLIDYLPLAQLLSPITLSRNLFYACIAGLLILSLIASTLLYRRIQIPMTTLVRSVQQLKKGNYSVRIRHKGMNEFTFLFDRFNEMAGEIQNLIENVLKEQIHSRDATLKLLQSQINPHFLYNCLFFINNMSRLGEEEAATTMTLKLAEYFRYTTRLERSLAKVREEVTLVENYLTIQKLRMNRLRYEIAMPEAMMDAEIPRLLLQPIVENAIVHGIEEKPDSGLIRIAGSREGQHMRIVIEDDGVGMTDEQLTQLRRQLRLPLEQDTGYALWNVQHRLMLQFDKQAGIELERSAAGGLKVSLVWQEAT